MTRGSKNDIRNSINFHTEKLCLMTLKWCKVWRKTDPWRIWWVLMRAVTSLKICTLACYFCWKYIMFEPKDYRGVMCNNTEEWRKFEEELTVGLKNDMRNLANFDSTLESLEIGTLISSFWAKYMFELKNYRDVMCHNTEGWCKILKRIIDWWFEKMT